jgi:hypothetical protein
MKHQSLAWALALAALSIAGLASADDLQARADHGVTLADLQDPTQLRLIALLSHYEQSPTAETLATLGMPNLQAALIAAAQNPDLPNIARGRALTSLGALPLAGAQAFLTQTLSDLQAASASRGLDPVELYLTGHLVRLIGQDLAAQDPVWAMTTLEPWIRHPDVGVREWAVTSLGAMRALPQAQAWADDHLVQLLLAERSPSVRDSLTRALDGVTTLKTPAGDVRRAHP